MFQILPFPAPVPAEDLALLAQVETATIGHFRHMGFVQRLSSVGPPRRVVGTAVTLALPGYDSTALHHVLSDARPGDILVIDRLGDQRHACWGGGVTRAAVGAGVTAAILDGPCTDPSEIIDEDFPLWCRGVSPITTRVLGYGGAINLPVCCGGAVVLPGDAILADESGIVVLRPQEVRTVAEEAIRRQNKGAGRQDAMRRGEFKIAEASGATRKIEAAMLGPN